MLKELGEKDELTTPAATGQKAGWLSLTLVAATVLMTLAIFPVASVFATDLGPGCAPDRPAIAHHAGGVIVDTEEKAPIPCTTATGFRTVEISIVITNNGTIFFEPALATETTGKPIGVLRSSDQGASWDFIDPKGRPPRTIGNDMNMWADRETGRVFWSGPLGIPAERVDYSDDDGQTWSPGTNPMPFDHTQIFGGPPTESLNGLQQGYPNVMYSVVAGGYTCGTVNFCGAHVSRSLDGGKTWGSGVALPYPAECLPPGENPYGGYGLNGVVGPDGTVYVPFTPCETPYLAISRNEGETWKLSPVADTLTVGWGELGLGADKDGVLYAAWTGDADRLPYLAISRDSGAHWSTPMMIGAPGVNEAVEPQLVVGAGGQVAVSYYGSDNAPLPFPPPCIEGTSGSGFFLVLLQGSSMSCQAYQYETWDTYITETFNALAARPLFWSATLNDPGQPTWYGISPSALRIPKPPPGVPASGDDQFAIGPTAEANGDGRADYFGMTMAPDRTPWVGFVQECPNGLPVLGNINCPSTLTGANFDGLFGFVGRLVRQ
jgi:hypothetical protein